MADDTADAADWLRHAVAGDKIKIAKLEAEIERLRLTDAEREAIERDLSWLQWCEDNRQIGDVGRKDIAALRGLLERLG
jgi:hypothetical protein